jgi:hypothetical protein
MKNLRVTIMGSGTQAEVVKALKDMAGTLESLNDAEIEKGGDLEDSTLTCQYDRINDDDEPEEIYVCEYKCSVCGEEWEIKSSCGCNDHCPNCDAEISPSVVRDVTEND